jgi:uncharacterized protein YndB with AHSA1/START domain
METRMASTPRRWIRKVGIAFGVLVIAWLVAILAVGNEATVESSVDIDRPPEVVFDYAADMRHELEWNPDVESMAKITDGPIGVGTKFQAKWKQSEQVVVECVRFDRPNRLTLENGGSLETQVDVSLTPRSTGTHFVSRFRARPHGATRLFFPIFVTMMRKFEAANMLYLKKAVESQPMPPPR